MTAANIDLRADVAILKRLHRIDRQAIAGLQLGSDPLEGFRPAILAGIDGVELDPTYEPEEFEGGAVGLRFAADRATRRVSIRAMRKGVVKWVRPDREPKYPGRFELALQHDNGDESYYGLLAEWSPRFQEAMGSGDDQNLNAIVGMSVEGGDRLGWVVMGSRKWLRLGIRTKDGTVLNPLRAVSGFYLTPDAVLVAED